MVIDPETTAPSLRFHIKTERGYCYGEEGGAYLFHRTAPKHGLPRGEAESLARGLQQHCRSVEVEAAP